jgi:hypothetical protein
MVDNQDAKPIDLLNLNIGRVPKEVAYTRYDICKGCDKLNSITKTCSECGCFMRLKVTLPNAHCPLHKWDTAEKQAKDDIDGTLG